MTKLLIGLLGAGVLATAATQRRPSLDDSTPARTVSLPAATTTGTTTEDTTTAATTTDTARRRHRHRRRHDRDDHERR